jgi:DNA-binding CsgD family transcriptional regulator
VRGPHGIGRSTLLRAVGESWRRDGIRVIEATLVDAVDAAGFDALVQAVREQFERIGDSRPLAATGRLAAAAAARRDAADQGPGSLLRAADALADLGRRLRAGGPTAFLVDDADAVAAPTLALTTLARAECLVVAVVAAPTRAGALTRAADTVIELAPLSPEAAAQALGERFGGVVDDGLLTALWLALGPLAGHPAILFSTVEQLEREGRLLRVSEGRRRHLCLADPPEAIALAPQAPLVTLVRRLGPAAERLVTAATVLPVGMDDLPLLAEATLGDADEYGRVVDDLVAAGALVIADGRLAPVCPALGARLTQEYGATAVRRLHRAVAAALLRRESRGERTDRRALADHVTAAGPTMPRDARMAAGLVGAARTVAQREPARAARWLRSALQHVDAGPGADRVLDLLLPLLVRTGRYDWLAEAVVAVERLRPGQQRSYVDAAAAALLAAVHMGVPVPPAADLALRTALVNRTDALDLAAWWFQPASPHSSTLHTARPAGVTRPVEGLLAPAELATLRAALRRPGTDHPPLADEILVAGSVGDVVTVLTHLLGPRYGAPTDGPLATHHRLVAAFGRGDAAEVLSLVRDIALREPSGSVVHALAALFAAEVGGRAGPAAGRPPVLPDVPTEPPFLGLRWWVGAGANSAEPIGLLRDGVAALRSAPGGGLGVELSLARMADLAAWTDDHAAPRLLEDAAAAACSGGFRVSERLSLLVRSVLDTDATLAAASADLAREDGDRPALATACLVAAGVGTRAGHDPAPWLRDAYAALPPAPANQRGGWALRARIGALLRAHGLRPARPRSDQRTFSAVEAQIIELIRGGHTNRQIAARVRLSEKTVESYLTRLYARTGCRSRVELATARLSQGGTE